MLGREARVVARTMADWPDAAFPVAYLACGLVADDRDDVGHDRVLAALRERGAVVVMHELARAPGVDVAGDLLADTTWEQLRDAGCRSVLCTNLLEHLADRGRFVELVTAFLPPGGRLLVSVPGRYPYHPDPIDTMYRPDPIELAAAFPQLLTESASSVVGLPPVLRLLRSPKDIGRKVRKSVRARRAEPSKVSAVPPPGGRRDVVAALAPSRVSVVDLRRAEAGIDG